MLLHPLQEFATEEASNLYFGPEISPHHWPVFTVSPLGPGYYYSGPTAASATDCQCNTVYYSLVAACSVCQDRIFVS